MSDMMERTMRRDLENKIKHYHKGGIDVIGFLLDHFGKDNKYTPAEGFFIGNVIKYVCRYKDKNGLTDLYKARDYLDRLIKEEQENAKE